MTWNSSPAPRRRSLVLATGLNAITLGGIACHREAVAPPPREALAITDKFCDVKSLGTNSFLLLGYRCAMAPSEDGGLTWKKIAAPTKRNLTRMAFLDGKSGWGVGHEG